MGGITPLHSASEPAVCSIYAAARRARQVASLAHGLRPNLGFLSSAPGTLSCLWAPCCPSERSTSCMLLLPALTPVFPSPTAAYQGTCACEEVGTKVIPMRHPQ